MKAQEIMAEVNAVEQLEAGEAMYYDPHADAVTIGRDGCQPSNTLCLRVGPDHLSDLDTGEIADAVEHWLGE